MIESLLNKFKKTSETTEPIITFSQRNKDELISPDSILVNAKENGSVYCLEDVIVDSEGEITGNIYAKSCTVNGKVTGNILSSEFIEINSTAVIEGNVKSASIEIKPGSIVNGFISIDKKLTLASIQTKIEEDIKNSLHSETIGNTNPVANFEENEYDASTSRTIVEPTPVAISISIPEDEAVDIADSEKSTQEKEIEKVKIKVDQKSAPTPSTDSWW